MSLREALEFVRAVREDAALRAEIERLGPDATLEQVAAIGARLGRDFTVDELRAAHAHDWGFRSARFADGGR